MDGSSVLGRRYKKHPEECVKVIEEAIFDNIIFESDQFDFNNLVN